MYRTYLGGWAASKRAHIDDSWPDSQDAAGCGGFQVRYIEYQPLSLRLLPYRTELASSHDVSVSLRLIIITPATEHNEIVGGRGAACRSQRVFAREIIGRSFKTPRVHVPHRTKCVLVMNRRRRLDCILSRGLYIHHKLRIAGRRNLIGMRSMEL